MNLAKIVKRRKQALKSSTPKNRDKLRQKYREALMAQRLRKECAA